MIQRYFIELAFKGTRYHGWQRQKNAHSVQAELERALSAVLREEVLTTGCGRTDTGVHARQFFAHFDAGTTLENPADFAYHLGCMLPQDIAVRQVIPVHTDAHARFDAIRRTYEYHVYSEKDPFFFGTACFAPDFRGMEKMNEAARLLIGSNDFSAFCKGAGEEDNHLCTVEKAEWKRQGDITVFTISANRFLRNMVRAIAGTLMDVGRERVSLKEFKKILDEGNRSDAGVSVPACGLYLTEVKYKESVWRNTA